MQRPTAETIRLYTRYLIFPYDVRASPGRTDVLLPAGPSTGLNTSFPFMVSLYLFTIKEKKIIFFLYWPFLYDSNTSLRICFHLHDGLMHKVPINL